MDDDWQQDIIQEDCFISGASNSIDDDVTLDLSNFDAEDFFKDTFTRIKAEPSDETSDYHGSSSGSPSSSLSSPNNFKEEPLGLDMALCDVLNSSCFSPPQGSSHSPGFGMMNSCQDLPSQQHSPIQQSSKFSPFLHQQQFGMQHVAHQQQHQQQQHQQQQQQPQNFHYIGNNTNNLGFRESMIYEGIGGMGLAAAQIQLKSRNRMHEMAVKQRLISDQTMIASGEVQLSAEEKRTLQQEGYDIPRKLPLSKSEEEALKIVRRKIKNKLSAQESRRKRKEYLDALELRVQGCMQESQYLKNKIRHLEASNRELLAKLEAYESGAQIPRVGQRSPQTQQQTQQSSMSLNEVLNMGN